MCERTSGMVAMGIIIGTCVPDAEQDSAYGAQIRRPPRRILYGMHFMVFCLALLLNISLFKTQTKIL